MANMARINPEGIRRYMKGYAGGGAVLTPPILDVRRQPTFPAVNPALTNPVVLPASGQPTIPTGFSAPATQPVTAESMNPPPAVSADQQPRFPAVRLGFSNAGRIPGKVNPNVADDVTIDAKAGEHILSIEDVDNLGGPKAVEDMVLTLRKAHGQSLDMGPKMRNEPDAQGRMNARGMRGFAGGGDVNPDKMYTGNGPLSKFIRRFRNNPATPEGVPTGYDRSMDIANSVGATLKSWGREAQPELAGQDTGVWNTDVIGGIKRWDEKQRNPDAVVTSHNNLNLRSDLGTPPAAVQPQLNLPAATAAQPVPQSLDWTKAGADAIKAVGGFGRQPVSEVTASPEDEASRLAARNAQYAATAADAAATDAREGFGAKALAGEKAARAAADTKERIAVLNNVISAGQRPEQVEAAKAELATIVGQQNLALKADEIAAGLERENIRGGFGLREQALRNEGDIAAENVRGGFTSKTKELDPSQIAENNARAALLTKQAEGTLSKEEQIKLQGLEAREKARVAAVGHILANQNLDDTQKQSAIAQLSTAEGEMFVPGTPEIPKKKGFLGFGKREAVPATPGRNVKAGNIELTVAQKLMAKYGNDPAKARAAYAAGER